MALCIAGYHSWIRMLGHNSSHCLMPMKSLQNSAVLEAVIFHHL